MGQINPDPTFIRDLKGLSTELNCYFDDKERKFIITHDRAVGGPIAILPIKNEDGSFRHPTIADVSFIASGDTQKMSHKERQQSMAKYMRDYEVNHRRKTSEMFREKTKDDKLQLIRKFAQIDGHAKTIQPFRKIERKPKGKVF